MYYIIANYYIYRVVHAEINTFLTIQKHHKILNKQLQPWF